MRCPHCALQIHFSPDEAMDFEIDREMAEAPGNNGACIEGGSCPSCHGFIVMYSEGRKAGPDLVDVSIELVIYPQTSIRPVDSRVPEPYRSEFIQAANVLNLSPMASAAISRRILQSVLADSFQLTSRKLASQIDAFLKLDGIPPHVKDSVDMIRMVGNFAAHPEKSESTGEIVPVEPQEADWLLNVLEMLFDVAFVQPEVAAERRGELDKKLSAAGIKGFKTPPRTP